jgi:hypothetical protein
MNTESLKTFLVIAAFVEVGPRQLRFELTQLEAS